MAVTTRIQPISKDIDILLNEELSPKAQSQVFAALARDQIEDAKATNRSILGRVPRFTTFVDGNAGAPLESVRPDGVIVTEFELVDDVLLWIGEQLQTHSPVKSGRYRRSHTLFADGREIDVGGVIPAADEYVFINVVPYARKIERGSSSQAPDGVYQAVATLGQRRFGNVARITFSYRTAVGRSIIGGRAGNRSSERNPAVIVTLRK